jgi:hypothetical protein
MVQSPRGEFFRRKRRTLEEALAREKPFPQHAVGGWLVAGARSSYHP